MSQEKSVKPEVVRTITVPVFVMAVVLSAAWAQQAQDAKALYPSMAPIEQYLMANRNAEIALAQSAAPESISRDAEIWEICSSLRTTPMPNARESSIARTSHSRANTRVRQRFRVSSLVAIEITRELLAATLTSPMPVSG